MYAGLYLLEKLDGGFEKLIEALDRPYLAVLEGGLILDLRQRSVVEDVGSNVWKARLFGQVAHLSTKQSVRPLKKGPSQESKRTHLELGPDNKVFNHQRSDVQLTLRSLLEIVLLESATETIRSATIAPALNRRGSTYADLEFGQVEEPLDAQIWRVEVVVGDSQVDLSNCLRVVTHVAPVDLGAAMPRRKSETLADEKPC